MVGKKQKVLNILEGFLYFFVVVQAVSLATRSTFFYGILELVFGVSTVIFLRYLLNQQLSVDGYLIQSLLGGSLGTETDDKGVTLKEDEIKTKKSGKKKSS